MIHDSSFRTYERNCSFSVYGLNYSFFKPNEYAKLEFLLRFLFLSFLPFFFFFIFTSSYYLVLDEAPAGKCKSRRSSRKNSAENKTLSWQNKPREGSSLKWKSLGTAINPTGTLKICSVWRCAILFFSSVRAEAWKPLTRILVTRIFLISRLTRLSLLTYCFFKEKLCLLSLCGKISIALFRETRETMTTDRLNKINKKSFQCTLLCI